jgi:hypothetical protein
MLRIQTPLLCGIISPATTSPRAAIIAAHIAVDLKQAPNFFATAAVHRFIFPCSLDQEYQKEPHKTLDIDPFSPLCCHSHHHASTINPPPHSVVSARPRTSLITCKLSGVHPTRLTTCYISLVSRNSTHKASRACEALKKSRLVYHYRKTPVKGDNQDEMPYDLKNRNVLVTAGSR